ncbi:hypothetical protein DI487_04905 [Flavobacterium sediminis]|uniref:Replication initiation protein n=1 Tax=Flavobacterium sediminis TaxID=2201181 RepID=A0A2U8QSX0_9FLAO|nr:hypothetical protein [Flavobacterium sediminis]AWM13267.1 hypothetical protein DI487_04905 [Flavobacterium sediminis]
MIDFVRVHYNDKIKLETFIKDPNNFEKMFSVLEYHSAEVLYPYKVNLENIEVVVNEKSGYAKNSIHKLNNLLIEGKEHNHNDFTYSQLCSVIDYLRDNVIEITNKKLTQLEFGFNLRVPIPAQELISKSVLMHNFDRHSMINKFKGKGYLMSFEHFNYIIKIYDKAKQYKLSNENILRFEIKFLSSKEFNPLGVYNLNDLKNKEVLENLFDYLLKRFNELLIVDDYSEDLISEKDYEKLNMYSSFIFWNKLNEANKRQVKSNHKKRYLALLEKHNLQKVKNHLRIQLTEKFNQLLSK